jgi:hypothetical protein
MAANCPPHIVELLAVTGEDEFVQEPALPFSNRAANGFVKPSAFSRTCFIARCLNFENQPRVVSLNHVTAVCQDTFLGKKFVITVQEIL